MSDPLDQEQRNQTWGPLRSGLVRVACALLALFVLYGINRLWGSGRISGAYGWTALLVIPVELVVVLAWIALRGPRHPSWRLVIKALVCGMQAGAAAIGVAFIIAVPTVILSRSVSLLFLLVFLPPILVVVAMNAAFVARLRGVDWKCTGSAEES